MPEQVLLSRVPGQSPLSRWIAQIDRKWVVVGDDDVQRLARACR